jgi:hypothetical protein
MKHSGVTFRSDCDFTVHLLKWLMDNYNLTYETIAERTELPVTTIKAIAEEGRHRDTYNKAIKKLTEDMLNGVYNTPIDFDKAADRLRNRARRQHA